MIHGVMPNPDRVTPPQPAMFQLQMSQSFPAGNAHPAEEIGDREAGAEFVDLEVTICRQRPSAGW